MSEALMPYDPEACDCCDCNAPQTLYAAKSGTKTKCGYDEYDPSSPPKKYLERHLSGTVTSIQRTGEDCTGDCAEKTVETWTGSCVYDPDTCEVTEGGQYIRQDYDTIVCTTIVGGDTIDPICDVDDGVAMGSETLTDTTRTVNPIECPEDGFLDQSGSKTETLNDEFTTAELVDMVEDAIGLASWPGFSVGFGDPAMRDLSTNELTYTARTVKYKFRFKVPPNGLCYVINWVERSTPEGGSPTDTPMEYEWDGTVPMGYDPSDSSTWPTSDEYEIEIPASDGEVSVEDVEFTCEGC